MRAPLSLAEILPGPTDRAAFVGQTGSGKTTLAEAVCAARPFVVAHDSKGTLKWSGYTLFRSLAKMADADPVKVPRMIYRPDADELLDADAQDQFFRWCYDRGNCVVYVDEVFAVASANTVPHHLLACVTRGRERGVQLYASTQRPSGIPLVVLSESEHVYAFRLKLPGDRERMEDVTGIDANVIGKIPKRQFYYCPQDAEQAVGPMRLRLNATASGAALARR